MNLIMTRRVNNFTSLGIEGELIPDLKEFIDIDGDLVCIGSSYAFEGCLSGDELKRTGELLSNNYEDCEHLVNSGELRFEDIACPRGCFLPKYLRRFGG